MTILVTGGAGFIGSHLCERLVHQGQRVVALDNFDPYYSIQQKKENISQLLQNKRFSLVRGDIRSKALIESVISKHKVSKVVHLAAMAGVRHSVAHPAQTYDVNVSGTLNVLEACRVKGIDQLVFASSSSVYGIQKQFPTKETSPTDYPLNPYAASKKVGEVMCWNYHVNYGIPITALRFFTVYGPRNRPDMAVYKFGDGIFREKTISVFGDGSSKRDYTFVGDIAEAIDGALMQELGFEVLNLGNNHPVMLSDLIRLLEDSFGKKAKTKPVPWPKSDPNVTYADISKARRLLGWRPKTPVQKGIRAFADWYLER